MSKVLLINGSPNENGNTWLALKEVAGALEKNGVESEILYLGKQAVQGCIACFKCGKARKCVFNDAVNEVLEKIDTYDGIVVGSPVYFAGPNGSLCAFLDRLFYAGGKRLFGKVAAAVVCCRRGGATAALDRLNKYLVYSNMHIVGSQYWNLVHGMGAGEVNEDKEGMQTMRTLGENMAWMLKNIEAGKAQDVPAPEYERRVYTNFVR